LVSFLEGLRGFKKEPKTLYDDNTWTIWIPLVIGL
jgi:hypothetical protein